MDAQRQIDMQRKAEAQIFRQLFHYDTVCFKHCVKEPENRFTKEQEACLSKR